MNDRATALLLIVVALAVVASFVLRKTAFGRYTFAIGGDEDKSRMLGLPVNQVKVIVFGMSGALAGPTASPPPAQSEGACDPRSFGTEAGAKCPHLFGAVGRAFEDTCGRSAPGTTAELPHRSPCRSA